LTLDTNSVLGLWLSGYEVQLVFGAEAGNFEELPVLQQRRRECCVEHTSLAFRAHKLGQNEKIDCEG
jgi:hypothetical protein